MLVDNRSPLLYFAFRTKAEPPINYSFAKSPGADVPLIEQWNVQVSLFSASS